MDVRAALAGGAAALGVTTGAYDRHALQEAAADEDAQLEQRVVVLEDLSDLDHVLSVLQL
jgi:beta-phosphoglucomutase-like phosphatase (HAD superfamily)